MKNELAMFGMGCFWAPQKLFNSIPGVKKTIVGYAGGSKENPTYKEVCVGKTGHTEVIKIEYNPKEISYEDLLNIFWKNHNPEIKNKEQYKSIVFYYDEKQRALAEKKKEERYITEILPAPEFYKAEECHQNYYKKSSDDDIIKI